MAGGHFGREKDVSVMSDYDAYIGLDIHKDSLMFVCKIVSRVYSFRL